MNDTWDALAWWPLRTLLIGGIVLLMGQLLMLVVRQPARQLTIGVCTATIALLTLPLSLLPRWMPIPVGDTPTLTETQPNDEGSLSLTFVIPDSEPLMIERPLASANIPTEAPSISVEPIVTPSVLTWEDIAPWLLVAYGTVVLVMLTRLFVGHATLRRWWRSAEPVPPDVARLFDDMAKSLCPRAQVRWSNRVAGPVCFGILRPCVLLPHSMKAINNMTAWRCIFAHELDHLQRRDPLTAWLMGVTCGVYFIWPWLNGMRRRVRLAQEYLADAQAVRWTTTPADYAELLLQMIRPRPLPTGAVGATGTSSDLYRRVTMLLRTSGTVEQRCSRRWTLTLGSGLTALAIGASGLYWQPTTVVAQEPTPPKVSSKQSQIDAVKKALEQLKKDLGDNNESVKLLERTLKQLQESPAVAPPAGGPMALPAPVAPPPPPLPPMAIPFPIVPGNDVDDLQKEIQQMQDMIRRQMEEMMRAAGRRGAIGGVIIPGGQMPQPIVGQGRLGIRIERPTDALVSQLDLPNGQGLVCVDVPAESVAGKAGLKPHDILLEVAGKAVPSDGIEFVNNLRQIKADEAIDIVVLRKGRKETIKGVKLPEARAELPRFQPLPIPVPAPPAIALPAPPANLRIEAGPGESFRVERFNDAFTLFLTKNNARLTMTGSVEGGTAKAESIDLEVDGKSTKYESVEKLPKEYQEMAQRALKGLK